jgi:hypothetical protein
MQKWEYKVIITTNASPDMPHAGSTGTKNPEVELNEAGEQGWELLQVLSFPRGGAVSVCHYLKRPKAEAQDIQRSLAEMTE